MRFDSETTTLLRDRLMAKGQQIASLLAAVLAGKKGDPVLRALQLDAKPGERPEEALRRYLGLIEARRALLDAGDDAYGRCETCGMDLGVLALTEMAWADRCRAHSAS